MFDGQVIDGAWLSTTITVNEQEDMLLEASLAVQVTVVVPTGKLEPDAGLQLGVPTPGQLSVAVGALYVTTAEHWPIGALVLTLAGQVIDGACVSLTVTVNEQLAELPAASITLQLTVVVPFGNVEPEAGLHVTEPMPGQLSVAVGVV
jgi:hypothetical protein